MTSQLEKQNKLKKIIETNNKILSDFITLFYNLNNRQPMESEIIDNLKDKIEMSKLKKMLEDKNVLNLQINVEDDNSSVGDMV